MKNIAEDKSDNFEIDIKEFIKYESIIKCIIHSHNNYGHLSRNDMILQEKSRKPYGMINLINKSLDKVVFWGDQLPPQDLIGRSFTHGCYDCYGLVRDYYKMKGITLPSYPRENFWWKKDPSMLIDNFQDAGFKRIKDNEVREGDVYMMKLDAPVVNHSGIWLKNGMILHHLYKNLSGKDSIGRWQQFLEGFYRYIGEKNNA